MGLGLCTQRLVIGLRDRVRGRNPSLSSDNLRSFPAHDRYDFGPSVDDRVRSFFCPTCPSRRRALER